MTTSTDVAVRYPCCEHCIDIKEGCPRSDGHGSPCPIPFCQTSDQVLPNDFTPAWEGEDEIDRTKAGVETDIVLFSHEQHIDQMRDTLLDNLVSIVGYEPPGIRVLLRTLSHPQLVTEARLYFEAMDVAARCTKYEPPWNCAREAEAQYKNIKHGWMGAANGIGFDESWCESCRRKVMGT